MVHHFPRRFFIAFPLTASKQQRLSTVPLSLGVCLKLIIASPSTRMSTTASILLPSSFNLLPLYRPTYLVRNNKLHCFLLKYLTRFLMYLRISLCDDAYDTVCKLYVLKHTSQKFNNPF